MIRVRMSLKTLITEDLVDGAKMLELFGDVEHRTADTLRWRRGVCSVLIVFLAPCTVILSRPGEITELVTLHEKS